MAETKLKVNTDSTVENNEREEKENSPVLLKLKRTLSKKLSIKKQQVSEVPETEEPGASPTADSPTSETSAESGLSQTFTRLRNSFRKLKKKSSIQEETVPSPGESSSSIKNEDFIQNISKKPLTVMQIQKLIQSNVLDKAYANVRSLQLTIQQEQEALGDKAASVELTDKHKDLSLLYNDLRDKLTEIVRQSCAMPSPNRELLGHVAFIIQEQEKINENSGIRIHHWKAAVESGVWDALSGVHLDNHEQNPFWMAVHLNLLSQKILEQINTTNAELVNIYPPSFKVFETYVLSCHKFVGQHLKFLLGKVTELKDFIDILDFINSYNKKMLGNAELQPKKMEPKLLTLSDDLYQIIIACSDFLQEALHKTLEDIINHEQEVWKKKETPSKTEDGQFLISHVHIEICKMVSNYSVITEENLKKTIVCKCMEVLKSFPKRFEEKFLNCSCSLLGSDLLDCCLWAKYHIAYINSFEILKEYIDGYKQNFPTQVEEIEIEVDGLLIRLKQALLGQIQEEIEPYLSIMMTKKWLSVDEDFKELINRLETFSGYSKLMRHPSAQIFSNKVHYNVVKGYISQLLTTKYSCKGRKNDIAASKIREQWGEIRKLCDEMGSSLDWLHPLGDQLSEIIEQENKKDIKTLLEPLVEHYPDISKKQLSAILTFRDSSFSLEKSQVLQCFAEIKQRTGIINNSENPEHKFFSDIK